MPLSATLEVHFYHGGYVAVAEAIPLNGDGLAFVESLLLSAMAIRVLSNLGSQGDAITLARQLEESPALLASLDSGGDVIGGFVLVRYSGSPGAQILRSVITWSTDGNCTIAATNHGFDLWMTGYATLGPIAIAAVMRFLCRRFDSLPDDAGERFTGAMCGSLMTVGVYYREGRITPFANHPQMAYMVAASACMLCGVQYDDDIERVGRLASQTTDQTGCLLIMLAPASIGLCSLATMFS